MNRKKIFGWAWKAAVVILLVWFIFCIPHTLFNDPFCTVVDDHQGQLMAAQIASDGQWRFPERKTVPEKCRQCILYFEDEHFYNHPGINPFSIARAIRQNIKAGRIVSGGSTISAQVIRLHGKSKKRRVLTKIIELIKALRMELSYSKDEILNLYFSHAPFGGNVVGLDAAAWRYYGVPPEKLSWGECATLAVLPNAPALIYPGKNQEKLKMKRNRLLTKLKDRGVIDAVTCDLAQAEPLPEKPRLLPRITPHLLTRLFNEGLGGQRIQTTIHRDLQENANRLVARFHKSLVQNEILNAALLILDVESGDAIAYVGNTDCRVEGSGSEVDVITSPRSTGSILKPFLYAFMLKDGMILPKTLIPDIPTQISGYAPDNFDKSFDGAVPADNALARSLNIPAVRMLQDFGLERFHAQLKQLHFSTITKPAGHYGLSLILGGAEATLWELAGNYANMARVLNHFGKNNSRYDPADYHPANYFFEKKKQADSKLRESDIFGASSIWFTFEALTSMDRPEMEENWEAFSSSHRIAWKTGTSFGHRDAWAIGVTPSFVVAVWVGNADGEGRPGLTGISVAAPLMFSAFKLLPHSSWFDPPYDEMTSIPVCKKSGYRASALCETVDTLYVQEAGLKTKACPYHKIVHLNKEETYQVHSECYHVYDMVQKSWFVLPPVMEYYYKSKDPFYRTLPPILPACSGKDETNMDIIYPKPGTKIFIPVDLDKVIGKAVFEVAHRIPNTTVFWHLDEEYIGSTFHIHKMELRPPEGIHTIVLVDDKGEMISRRFEVAGK